MFIDSFFEWLGIITGVLDTVWMLITSKIGFGMGVVISATLVPFLAIGIGAICLLLFAANIYFRVDAYNKKKKDYEGKILKLQNEQQELESELKKLNIEPLIEEPVTKASSAFTTAKTIGSCSWTGFKAGFAAYGALLGISWGTLSTLGGIIPALVVFSSIPFIGWGIFAGIALVGIGIGCWWGYCTYKNNKRSEVCEALKDKNQTLQNAIDEKNTEKSKQKDLEISELKKENENLKKFNAIMPERIAKNPNPIRRTKSLSNLKLFDINKNIINSQHYPNTDIKTLR